MNKIKSLVSISLSLLFLISCAHAPTQNNTFSNLPNNPRKLAATDSEFPQLANEDVYLREYVAAAVKKNLRKDLLGPKNENILKDATDRLIKYYLFLGVTGEELKKLQENKKQVEADKKNPNIALENKTKPLPVPSSIKAADRLFLGTTQFLFCKDFRDWICLEKLGALTPATAAKVETKSLGKPVTAGDNLDLEWIFTEAWDRKTPQAGMAKLLADKISQDATKSLSMAMYGIDDVNDSMKVVNDAILVKSTELKKNLRIVADMGGIEPPEAGKPWTFNYVQPQDTMSWIFGQSPKPVTTRGVTTNIVTDNLFTQYKSTLDMLRIINAGVKKPKDSRMRIEWPLSGIMHNKFAVLERKIAFADGVTKKAVWTGTANIARTCMGNEDNTNMSVYIRNNKIADSFLNQFELMYNFDEKTPIKHPLLAGSLPDGAFYAGKFHGKKRPISKRLFTFKKEKTRVRLSFAPTDDAEHRIVIPMLLSAKEGDHIRISMFGAGGYELVRAMQYAVAKGARLQLILDAAQAGGGKSWYRDLEGNLYQTNPYVAAGEAPLGKLEIKVDNWPGLNHQKIGTISRLVRDANGNPIIENDVPRMHVEQIVIGSQNWSEAGNDLNDENLIAVQNLETDVPLAVAFNNHFDTRLWPAAKDESVCAQNKALGLPLTPECQGAKEEETVEE